MYHVDLSADSNKGRSVLNANNCRGEVTTLRSCSIKSSSFPVVLQLATRTESDPEIQLSKEREMAPIAVGDTIPDGTLPWFDENDEIQQLSIHSLAAGKKIVLLGVPGAFTPTCSTQHVPSFITNAEELKSKGVDEILLISVNDPFVLKAWAKSYPENKHVKFLADGSASYTRALGLELDLSEKGLGVRSRRFAILVDDLKVKVANIEEGGAFTISGADEILKSL